LSYRPRRVLLRIPTFYQIVQMERHMEWLYTSERWWKILSIFV